MELLGATTIIRKIILESGLIIVDGLSGDRVGGGGSGATIGANNSPFTVFKTNHYEYDHTVYIDFASPSECSVYNCRSKHDVVINAINTLTTFVKKLTSKRGIILSKRILFSSTPLEIKAKRRRKVISKHYQASKRAKLQILCSYVALSNVQCTMSKGE
ncbi:hypothetical protein FXO37_12465 [Capsicum annuum]|nr:hypothetical protein FXO37_12465 [Capsicum annuum]